MTKANKPQIFGNRYISNPWQVILDSFRAVWNVNRSTWLAFIITGVLTLSLGIIAAIAIVYAFKFEISALWMVPLLAGLIIWALVLLVAFNKYAIETAKGKVIGLTPALKVGYQKAAGFAGLTILSILITIGGLVLLIIPGLIFMYWFVLAPYIYIDQDVGVIEALRQSKKLATAQRAEILGVFGAGLVFSIPTIFPVIGFIYSLLFGVIWYVAWSYRYLSMQALVAKKKPKPATDPQNYWALCLGIVAFIIINLLSSALAS